MSDITKIKDNYNKKDCSSTSQANSNSNNTVNFDAYKNQRSVEIREKALENIIKSADKLNW